VGVSVVNALSKELRATIWKDGFTWTQRYIKGVPTSKVKKGAPVARKHGTRIEFLPDPDVFRITEFKPETIANRMDQLAYLNAGTKLQLQANGDSTTFQHSGGLTELVHTLTHDQKPIGRVSHFNKKWDKIEVDVGLRWCKALNSERLRGYTNCIRNRDGGTHLSGLRSAVSRAVIEAAKEEKVRGTDLLSGEDVREGLVGSVSLRMPNPKFSSQTKDKLISSEARTAVESVVFQELSSFLGENPDIRREIISTAVTAAKARIAARNAREAVRKDKLNDQFGILPGKLADCQSKNIEETELLLVEGDSAGGSTKQARDRKFQAVLPLRGKVLNVEGEEFATIRKNKELSGVVKALGTGCGPLFDQKGLRYGRVIIMTDADVDGSHIRALLLTFFYRQLLPLILDGRVCIARPPLFGVRIGKKIRYYQNEAALEEWRKEYLEHHDNLGRVKIQRYKGLGEMNPQQLWDTTLDPEKRTLEVVRIQDHIRANALFDVLMGDNVEPRRRFIERNSHLAALDV